MNENETIFIIFGASGDLARRKLIPALHAVIAADKLKKYFIIGAALDDTTAADLIRQSRIYMSHVPGEKRALDELNKHVYYEQFDFTKINDYTSLGQKITKLKEQYNFSQPNLLIYLAAPAHFYSDITRYIAESGIAKRVAKGITPWTRIVYEKPFGSDFRSADEINDCIAAHFDESQIYRIDHYLTKELVGNIAFVRFTNAVFEPLWNNRYIDNVQIILSEADSIGGRGLYYDHFGAIKDVMQNHMLELMALVAMETPKRLTGEDIREQRVKVLEKVEVVDSFVGQYEGYTKEENVASDSKTETYACAYLRINNPRWAGVPFYLKTGKCLSKKRTIIHIQFKQVDCLLVECPIESNVLNIEVSPQAGFSLRLNAKSPGEPNQIIPVDMEFCHSCIFGFRDAQAYETIFEEILRGEEAISVRFDEIEYAWLIIDEIKKQQRERELYIYSCGSNGPKEQKKIFDNKHGIRWLT